VAKDKRDRRRAELEAGINRRRFEQEVAEEIGVSLDRKLRRRNVGTAASPGTSGPARSGGERTRPEP